MHTQQVFALRKIVKSTVTSIILRAISPNQCELVHNAISNNSDPSAVSQPPRKRKQFSFALSLVLARCRPLRSLRKMQENAGSRQRQEKRHMLGDMLPT